jgi:DNA repair protein RadA/Sms
MPRPERRFVCAACGAASARWEGRCHVCGAWDTLTEELRPATVSAGSSRRREATAGASGARPERLRDAGAGAPGRRAVGIGEVDRVLGGGIVPGSLVLLGGEPGIGKSTLVLETAAGVVRGAHPSGAVASVLYVSGEEAPAQLHLRAERLGLAAGPTGERIQVLAETRLEAILDAAETVGPALLIVDSVQTLTADELDGGAGSIGQVRETAARLGAWAREHATPVILVGHVTKDGSLAGPRTLEHLVDAVLSLEGDRYGPLRLLRAAKNRFGSTEEVGVLEMTGDGLREVGDPARAFLGEGSREAPGVVVASVLEGTRPMLVEVQALVAGAGIGLPRRTLLGVSPERLALIVAVLGRRCGVDIGARDLYVSLAGGVAVSEPALDLPVALALASSATDRALPAGTVACGEVSLLGELRPVRGLERRLREAARLGFDAAIVPAAEGVPSRLGGERGLRIVAVRTLREAVGRSIPRAFGTTGEG